MTSDDQDKDARQFDATMEQVALELQKVNIYVAACAEHGVIEAAARRLVPAIREICGSEPLGLDEFQDAVLARPNGVAGDSRRGSRRSRRGPSHLLP